MKRVAFEVEGLAYVADYDTVSGFRKLWLSGGKYGPMVLLGDAYFASLQPGHALKMIETAEASEPVEHKGKKAVEKVYFEVERQAFAFELEDCHELGKLWIVSDEGDEIEDKYNTVWNNLQNHFTVDLLRAAETAREEQ